jgi:hypothetical protein
LFPGLLALIPPGFHEVDGCLESGFREEISCCSRLVLDVSGTFN